MLKLDKTQYIHDSSKLLECNSKKRPDLRILLDDRIIIIEIDEDQHKRYSDSCECARLNEIINSIDLKATTYIIRFNPDSYILNSSNGSIRKNTDLKIRTKVLYDVIKIIMEKPADTYKIMLTQLYYDNPINNNILQHDNITDLLVV
jgi:hypothetical protein